MIKIVTKNDGKQKWNSWECLAAIEPETYFEAYHDTIYITGYGSDESEAKGKMLEIAKDIVNKLQKLPLYSAEPTLLAPSLNKE